MSKILITGAGGFIGIHLVNYLLQDNVNPRNLILFDRPDSITKKINSKCKIIEGDIRSMSDVTKAVEGVDVIYHLATKTGANNNNYRYLKDTNVDGTRNLVNAAIKYNVKKFIFFSSAAVYGSPSIVGNIKNINETNDVNISDNYGRTKYEAEKIVKERLGKTKIKYIIIRPTNVFGPGSQGGINQQIKAIKGRYFFYIGNGMNKVDYIYVRDLVKIVRDIEKSAVTNEDFIVASGEPHTQKKISELIAKKLNVRNPSVFIPKNVVLFISVIIDFFIKIFFKKNDFFSSRVKMFTSDFYFDISKLIKFGFAKRYNFEKALSKTIDNLEQ
jgi:nucleoside-diphosphate-sugar epimerase